jgi:glycosyltransferase involved in cell wall biosynthesis
MATPLTPILLVIDNLEYGGGERGFLQLVRGLGAEGWAVTVAAHPGGLFEREARAAGACFVPLDMRRQRAPLTIVQLRRLVQRGGFRLVHSQGARADVLARVALLGLGDVRNVCTVQMPVEGFDVGGLLRLVYLALDRLSGRRVDRFVVVSQALRRLLIGARGLPPDRVALVYNGVETATAATLGDNARVRRVVRQELGLGDDALLVGAVGRLVWQKGFSDLVRALPEVLARVPQARLVIAGEGPLGNELAASARTLGVGDRVKLTGFRHDVLPFLAGLDVLVIPSLKEGFPMITLEAMALGAAIVATAIDGITEQIEHGVHGLLVPPGETRALGDAIVSLLDDPRRRRALGQAARRRAAAVFDVAAMVAGTTAVYAELLGATPEPAR